MFFSFTKLVLLLIVTVVMGEENCFQNKNNQPTHSVSFTLLLHFYAVKIIKTISINIFYVL